ncbi:hypothetical protein JI58_03490 [Marinosulfonomonas sp. PRT-SC04]|nr:hypothetical protein JI58_03490 [Marinosulfonomonas sp. PRT-SC04]
MLGVRIGACAILLLLLAGCFGAPELPILNEMELAKNAPESGLISADAEAVETVLQEPERVENVPVLETVPPLQVAPAKPRRGLAALFGRRNAAKIVTLPTGSDALAVTDGVVDAPTDTAEGSNSADVASQSEAAALASIPEVKPRGLFGPRRRKPSQPNTGMMLPFGQIELACGVETKQLGKEVDRFPEGGKGYRLYDSDPSTTQPRTHYITGFKDGCPRQFTASLALLESPVFHEQLLLLSSSQAQHSMATDKTFQKVREPLNNAQISVL